MKNIYLIALVLIFSISVLPQTLLAADGDIEAGIARDVPGGTTLFPSDGNGDVTPGCAACANKSAGSLASRAVDDPNITTSGAPVAPGKGAAGSAH